MTSWSSSIKIYKLIEYIIKKICQSVKRNAKICAIGETECNQTLSLYLRRTKNLSEEKEGIVEMEKREDPERNLREDRDREKRDKRELS